MSEALFARGSAERVARIWQPAEFLHAGGRVDGFVATRWQGDAGQGQAFMPQLPPGSAPGSAPGGMPGQEPAPDESEHAALAAEPAVEPPPEPEPQPEPEPMVSEQVLEAVRQEAFALGLAQARQEAEQHLAQLQQVRDSDILHAVQSLQAAVAELQASPEQLYEPLKRLALHLAEQLVLAELSQSPQAIERLVRRCVDELAKGAAVQVALHPDDLAMLEPWLERSQASRAEEGAKPPAWRLLADDRLRPGSVRASAEDAVVEDLVEHRLDALARQLRVDASRASGQSAFRPERVAARRAEVDAVLDAQPRMAEAPRNPRFAPVVEAQSPPPAPPPDDPALPPAIEGEGEPLP